MKVLFRNRGLVVPQRVPPSGSAPIDDERIVEIAIKNFYHLREQGSELSPAEYAERYPAVKSMLLADLEFEESLGELANDLSDVSPSDGGLSSWEQESQQSDDETLWPKIDDRIGDHTLVEQIGGGRFSRVFAARSSPNARPIAIKFCRHQGTHEARTLAEVVHSAIGVVQGVERVPRTDLIAISMPLKSRTTLADVLRSVVKNDSVPASADFVWEEVQTRNKLLIAPPAWAGTSYVAWAQSVMSTLAEALSAAHGRSTAHCDIKPSNVLVTAEGKPILIDFNLSLRWDVESSSPNIGGTLPYMAPEQIRAFDAKQRGDIGPRTDIYGLAATMYQLLTGELPFEPQPDGDVKQILKQRKQKPRPIEKLNPHVPAAFASVIMKCLSYDPKQRPRTAADLFLLLNKSTTADDNPAPRRRVTPVRATMAMSAVALAAVFMVEPSPQFPYLSIPALQASPSQLMNAGYDALEAEDIWTADENFRAVLAVDPEHKGAMIACIRAKLRKGDFSGAEQIAESLTDEDAPELRALQGMCLAAQKSYETAEEHFRFAIEHGLDTREVLTNLGYCLSQSGQHQEAIEVLEEVRSMGGDTSTANLILAQNYWHVWQQGKSLDQTREIDTGALVGLVNECPISLKRSLNAAFLYASIASKWKLQGEEARTRHWARLSLSEFDRGCELGLDPTYWPSIKELMPESVTLESLNVVRPPAGRRIVDQNIALLISDAIIGTRFERHVERTLDSNSLRMSE